MADGCANCRELESQLRAARLGPAPAGPPDQRRMQRIDTLGQLAAAITHEYNNTLGVILQSSEMLLDESDPGACRAHAERIQRAASRARQFTLQLSTFGRARSLRRAPLECDAVVADLRHSIARQCEVANVRIDVSLAGAGASVLADRAQFETLMHSLIANARDAMPSGGVLGIATCVVSIDDQTASADPDSSAGEYLALAISDTGAGVPAETIEHIFEPFFTTKPRAMGLGLAAVYAIAKSSGGFVRVENRPLGGATFTVYLPIVQ
jgi:two-component system cell cycle sensor histidine kinase/response regulator CckA